ncbi:MAG: adenylosuccinate lyase, partial [Clostridium sp.]|nr:adenylosuccinate lyase [Clostridium sp.]
EAAREVKEKGKENDLIERIAKDEAFGLDIFKLNQVLDAKNYIGRSKEQVEEFVRYHVEPVLKNSEKTHLDVELNV